MSSADEAGRLGPHPVPRTTKNTFRSVSNLRVYAMIDGVGDYGPSQLGIFYHRSESSRSLNEDHAGLPSQLSVARVELCPMGASGGVDYRVGKVEPEGDAEVGGLEG